MSCRITIKGDERLEIESSRYVDIPVNCSKIWGDVENEIREKCFLKNEWPDEYYGIYDFRLNDENGVKLTRDTPITENITVYVRTNYKKFSTTVHIFDSYSEKPPRGRIIIPEYATRIDIGKLGGKLLPLAEGITEIDLADCRGITDIYLSSLGIKDIDLTKCCKLKTLSLNDMCITDIDLSSCKELVILELTSTRIENIDLLCCKNLTRVCFRYSEYLTKVDLTACKNLKIIQLGDFTGCKEASVKLPASITGIMEGAFGENDDSYCKKVLVPNEEMKQLVIASGYPEDRIEMY